MAILWLFSLFLLEVSSSSLSHQSFRLALGFTPSSDRNESNSDRNDFKFQLARNEALSCHRYHYQIQYLIFCGAGLDREEANTCPCPPCGSPSVKISWLFAGNPGWEVWREFFDQVLGLQKKGPQNIGWKSFKTPCP